jgi:hypothetical protein
MHGAGVACRMPTSFPARLSPRFRPWVGIGIKSTVETGIDPLADPAAIYF